MLDCTYRRHDRRTPALHALADAPFAPITTHRILKGLAGLYLVALLAAVMAYKAAFAGLLFANVFFGVYSRHRRVLHRLALPVQPLLPHAGRTPAWSRTSRS